MAMPNFLLRSPAYMRRPRKAVLARRAALLDHRFVTSGYHYQQGKRQATVTALKRKGHKTVTPVNLSNDLVIFRKAEEFLNASPEEQEELAAKAVSKVKDVSFHGIRCLVKDGITSWDQLGPEPTAPTPPAPAPAKKSAGAGRKRADNTPTKPAAELAEEPPVVKDFLALGRDVLSQLNDAAEKALDIITRLAKENQELRERVQVLEGSHLEPTDISTLGEDFPEIGKLLEAVRSSQTEEPAPEEDRGPEKAPTRRRATPRNPRELLPRKSTYHSNADVTYADQFLQEFDALSDPNQRAVTSALRSLTSLGRGPNEPDLKTEKRKKKVGKLPAGSSVSRATRSLYFGWKKVGEEITIRLLGHPSLFQEKNNSQ